MTCKPLTLDSAVQPQEIAEIAKKEQLGMMRSFTRSVSLVVFLHCLSLSSFAAIQSPFLGLKQRGTDLQLSVIQLQSDTDCGRFPAARTKNRPGIALEALPGQFCNLKIARVGNPSGHWDEFYCRTRKNICGPLGVTWRGDVAPATAAQGPVIELADSSVPPFQLI